MKITWIGHSCFKIENEKGSVVIDPYEDGSVPGLKPVRESADAVLISHGHGDHSARKRVTVTGSGECPFAVTKIETFHDPEKGALRGPNTIHLLSVDGFKIAHFGDLGCDPEPSQLEALRGLDAALIPVGGFYTIDAAQAAALVRAISPAHVIPMHYRGENSRFGFDVLTTVRDFTDRMPSVVFTGSDSLDFGAAPDAQVIVLTPQNAE